MKEDRLSSTEKVLAEFLGCLNDWVNNSTRNGSAEAWRDRLVTKNNEHYRASWCLRGVAKHNRPAAVDVAIELDQWGLFNDGQHNQDLLRVVGTLIRFPKDGELEEYLQSLSINLGKIHDDFVYDQAFLAEDFIVSRGAAIRFDCETGVFPNHHDKLMHKLSATSGLKSASFSEIAPDDYDDRSLKYLLKADINGKSYETSAGNFGDWFDYLTVVNFLNEISSDQGLDEIYVLLHTGDQTACVWQTDPKMLATLLDEGLIKLSEENKSLEEGVSFEQSLINQFK